MKAWSVQDTSGDFGIVLFAETRGQAHSLGTQELDEEWCEVRVKRAPAFDDLAPGPVTDRDYLARGWWVYCPCSAMVFDDGAVMNEQGEAFCSERCRDR